MSRKVAESAGCRLLTSSNIKTLTDSIDTVLCDCDGVLYHMNTVIPGIPEAVHKLKSMGKRFFYVTNNSTKTRSEFAKKCTGMGLPAKEDDIIGSAYVAALFLKQNYNYSGKVYVIGATGLADELHAVGLKTVGVGPDSTDSNFQAAQDFVPDPEVKCVVVGVDEHFSYLKASKAATYLANKDCLFVATNPDSGLPSTNGRILPGAGSCVAMVKVASQREPEVVGKPNQVMFDVVMSKYNLNPKKTLMIGDRLDTDILFAGKSGLQSLLVLTGFSNLDDVKMKQQSKLPSDKEQIPSYYLPSLADLTLLLNTLEKH